MAAKLTLPSEVRTVPVPNAFAYTPIPQKNKRKVYPSLGANVFKQDYAVIVIVGMSGQGKTTDVFNIFKAKAGPQTTGLIFCPSKDSDTGWEGIIDWCNKYNIRHVEEHSIHQNGHNLLQEFNEGYEKRAEIEKKQRKGEIAPPGVHGLIRDGSLDPPKKKEYLPTQDPQLVKIGGVEYSYPAFIVVLDDNSADMKDPAVLRLVRTFRHKHAILIMSTQRFKDNATVGRLNATLFLLHRGVEDKNLQEIHGQGCRFIDYKVFLECYMKATSKDHGFLMINTGTKELFDGFGEKFVV